MEKDNDDYKINISGIEALPEKVLCELIDELVDYYIQNFGTIENIEEDVPEKPDYTVENLDLAKEYLKKYRLQ